ncbi:MAG: DNA adenine methylase [Clostridiales Family XIII bacterium]|nr:DNA adenine methylase [Clostridiales Family XIII bacterium]
MVRPCLKWAGGKRQLLPEIRKRLPDNLGDLRYYEPFVGAGALFLDRQPRRAVVNDNNEQLVLTYRAIRDQVDELVAALNAHRERDSEEYYYRIREQDRDSEKFAGLSAVQKAARLIYLNKTCYNGLYRVNSQGLFNVPYGRHSDPRICDEPVLRAIHGYLNCESAEIEILNGDFEAAVETAGQGAFVYFDPPYHGPGNNSFTGYQAGGFGEDEQRRLRDVFARLTAAGARCLLSNSDTPFVRELYSDEGFEIVAVKARRAINSDGAGRGAAAEVLVKNWK